MMNGGVVPGGICLRTVCEIAVTCAVAASILAPGWKKILMTDDAGERLALDVLDVVDGRGERALVVRDDALLHLLGRQARVVPDDGDDRDVDVREDVRRHPEDRDRRHQQDDDGHHDERVRAASARRTIHMGSTHDLIPLGGPGSTRKYSPHRRSRGPVLDSYNESMFRAIEVVGRAVSAPLSRRG